MTPEPLPRHALRAGHPVDCRCSRPYQLPGRRVRRGARPARPSLLSALWPFVRALIPGALIIAAGIAARLMS